MELPVNEGGAGGKMQRRLFRRRGLTPYDRPSSAVRGPRRVGTASETGSGWLSKLVSPASRIIAGGATRLLSSVFSKRLAAPDEDQEQRTQLRVGVPNADDTASEELLVQAVFNDLNQPKDSGTYSISEIEHLIKQKTYTRNEVDYLTGLICSRTIEPLRLELQCNKDNVSDEENSVRSTRNLSALASAFTIPQDAAASPTEIAKAFMSSRPPKVASAINLHRQVPPVDKSLSSSGPLAVKAPELEVAMPSALPFSADGEPSGAGYQTPKSRGRSAIYRMSRSPYFKVDASPNVKWNVCTAAGNAGFTASQLTPGSCSKSDGHKVLKRGSSVLYNDHGSFGPIRQLRQKFNVISASKDLQLVSATNFGVSLPQLDKDGLKGSASTQSLSPVNEVKCGSAAVRFSVNTDTKMLSSRFPSVSGQSSEAGMRIFDVEKFTPPEKRSDIKPISRDESPSKLTTNMLNGRALKSMENVDKSQFISMDANVTSEFGRGSQQLSGSLLKKHGQVLENGPSKPDIVGVKLLSAVNGVNKNSSLRIQNEDGAISFPAPIFTPRKPAFQMTAPEEFLELDDEDDDVDMSVQSDPSRDKTELPIHRTSASGIPTSSMSTGVPNSISFSESSKMDNDASYSLENNRSGHKFSVATEPIYNASAASTSTFPTPSEDKLVLQVERATVPDFCVGSRSTNSHLFSSATCVASESVGTKAAVDSLCSDEKVQLETSDLLGRDKSDTKGLGEPAGIFISSAPSTLDTIENASYDGSITLSRSNGSLHSSSLSSFVSASIPAVTAPPVSSFFLNSISAATRSPSPPVTSTSPLFSSTNMFSFLGGTSAAFPSSVALSSDKSSDVNSVGKVVNNTPSGYSGPPAQGSLELISTGSSSSPLMGISPFSGSGSASSNVAVSSLSTGMATSSAPAASSIFLGASTSGSGFGAPLLLSSKNDGIFDFSSAQPVSLSISADTSSSQDSTNIIGATGMNVFGVQPLKSSSSGSLFSQSSTSNSISFSSCPTSGLSSISILFGSSPSPSPFGLSSSSTPGFSNTPFTTGNQSAISFGLASGLSFSASETSAIQSSQFLFPSIAGVYSSSSLFSFTTSSSNSSNGLSFLTGSSSSSSDLSFIPSSTSSSPAKSTVSLSDKSPMFSSSSLGSTSSIPCSTFGSSPSTGFSFGLAATASGASSFGFSSSTGSIFSFTSSGATNSLATSTPVFGVPSSAGAFTSISQNNDQMNVEDSMSDDTNQAPAPIVPAFGQSSVAPASQNFAFGSSFTSGGTPLFQFGSHQNPTAPQNSNPFQAGGSLEFAPGGSFSWGSGGGEKSSRKIVRPRRDRVKRNP